jgi:hypothetical protein
MPPSILKQGNTKLMKMPMITLKKRMHIDGDAKGVNIKLEHIAS